MQKTYKRGLLAGLALLLVGLLLADPLVQVPASHAQDDAGPQEISFTWRPGGMIIRLPGGWVLGEYEDTTLAVSGSQGLDAASQGDAPGVPAIAFLFYPPTSSLVTPQFMAAAFPGLEPIETSVAGVRALQADFDEEATGHAYRVVAFTSPVTQNPLALLATAPQGQWAAFEPDLAAILDTIQFLDGDGELNFLEAEVTFQYPTAWSATSNGQVQVAAPTLVDAENALNGDLAAVPVFVRAQILAPSGLGLDPDDEDVPQRILERFVGRSLEDEVIIFDWGEEQPAAAVELVLENHQLVLVAVVEGDVALLIGGGALAETWPESRRTLYGVLNMTRFNAVAPPANLDAILAGEVVPEGPFGR